MVKRNFRIDKKEWEKFKQVCKANDTDVSKALRQFISQANEYNSLDYNFNQTSIFNFIEDK